MGRETVPADHSYIRVAAAELSRRLTCRGGLYMSHLIGSVLGSATTTLVALVHVVANGWKW